MEAKMYCPFCKEEITLEEVRDAIENSAVFPHIADIDTRERDGHDYLSVLLDEPYMTCVECRKEINLNQDGLLVGKDAETAVKMIVKVET